MLGSPTLEQKTGNPTGSTSPWLGMTGFFRVYVAELTDGFEDLLLWLDPWLGLGEQLFGEGTSSRL